MKFSLREIASLREIIAWYYRNRSNYSNAQKNTPSRVVGSRRLDVRLEKVAGDPGDATGPCTFTYDAYPIESEAGDGTPKLNDTPLEPISNRWGNIEHNPATNGKLVTTDPMKLYCDDEYPAPYDCETDTDTGSGVPTTTNPGNP